MHQDIKKEVSSCNFAKCQYLLPCSLPLGVVSVGGLGSRVHIKAPKAFTDCSIAPIKFVSKELGCHEQGSLREARLFLA